MNDAIHICYGGNRRVSPGCCSPLCRLSNTPTARCGCTSCLWTCMSRTKITSLQREAMEILNAVLRKKRRKRRRAHRRGRSVQALARRGQKQKQLLHPYATLRLYLNELDGIPDKLLYLDIDTMCLQDVSALYDIDLGGCRFAGVPDRLGKFFVNKRYCNSGCSF